jgi:hypothetical protein
MGKIRASSASALVVLMAAWGLAPAGEPAAGDGGAVPDGAWLLAPAGLYRAAAPAPAETSSGASLPRTDLRLLAPAAASSSLGAEVPGWGFLRVYFEAKAGPIWYFGEFKDLSPGVDLEGAVGFHPIRYLAIEALSGYFWGQDDAATYRQLWGIPLVGNLKLLYPVHFLEPYVGAGGGGFFVHTREPGTAVPEADDWVAGFDVLAGVNVNVDRFLLSIEGKYLFTEKAETVRGPARLEGAAVLVGLGMRF